MTSDPIEFAPAPEVFSRERVFRPIDRILEVDVGRTEVRLLLETVRHDPVYARISFPHPRVVRLQWAPGSPPDGHMTEMLTGPPAELPLRIERNAERLAITAGGPALCLELDPWRVRFGPYRSARDDHGYYQRVTVGGGWASTAGRTQCYETFSLSADEHLYGLGERFLGPNLRGRRCSHWITDGYGTGTTDLTSKSIPLVVSSRGYGLFFHSGEEAIFDLGARSAASATALVESDQLDLFVMLGDPKEVLYHYTALTGRASVPPAWSFGIWLSRCFYNDLATVEEVLRTAARVKLPVSVVNLDAAWLANAEAADCDFVWNEAEFGPLDKLVRRLHDDGLRLSLWVNPHVVPERYDTVGRRALVGEGRHRNPVYPSRAFVDFTGDGAAWWHREIGRLLDLGVDSIKLDYGEALPPDARMADGRRGSEVHNLYPLLASATAAEAGLPVGFTRAGTAGSQRFPLHWSGDVQSSWEGLAGTLRGGLSASWSGLAHWTSDVGGFYRRDFDRRDGADRGLRPPAVELYIRWMQFAMLCSHTRFHGLTPREPWFFGSDAVDVARRFARLRQDLTGYLLDCAVEASSCGVPLMRPLALEYPGDRGSWDADTTYLLGPDLLVAPVLEPGGRAVFYVPPGNWVDWFTAEHVEGPGWQKARVPIDRIPLFKRVGGSFSS